MCMALGQDQTRQPRVEAATRTQAHDVLFPFVELLVKDWTAELQTVFMLHNIVWLTTLFCEGWYMVRDPQAEAFSKLFSYFLIFVPILKCDDLW